MNCPSCQWPNKDALVNCDYCGTPLAAAVAPKRKTEVEVPPYAGAKGAPKRVTEIEATAESRPKAGDVPFDPFQVPSAPARPKVAVSSEAPKKRVTVFDPGDAADPFRPTTPERPPGSGSGSAAVSSSTGRRIVGWLVTFDGNADGMSYVLREGRNVIGRAAENDVIPPGDEMVSSTHAYLIWRAGRARA